MRKAITYYYAQIEGPRRKPRGGKRQTNEGARGGGKGDRKGARGRTTTNGGQRIPTDGERITNHLLQKRWPPGMDQGGDGIPFSQPGDP